MPTVPLKACRTPGCPSLTDGTHCPEHATPRFRNAERDRFYSTARWRNLRRAILRDSPWCVGPGCLELAVDVDHVEPLRSILERAGNPYDRTILQGLCKSCHAKKTRAEQRSP